jgi:hypothetical protein
MSNCFCLWYSTGYQFDTSPEEGLGAGNALLTNCGADLCSAAVHIRAVQNHAGVSFNNGQFMGKVIIEESNRGPVKFTGCGFWGDDNAENLVAQHSSGWTAFINCQFSWWDRKGEGYPAIFATNGILSVVGSMFAEFDKMVLFLSSRIRGALISANVIKTRRGIVNRAKGKLKIRNNYISHPKFRRANRLLRKRLKKMLKRGDLNRF